MDNLEIVEGPYGPAEYLPLEGGIQVFFDLQEAGFGCVCVESTDTPPIFPGHIVATFGPYERYADYRELLLAVGDEARAELAAEREQLAANAARAERDRNEFNADLQAEDGWYRPSKGSAYA